MSSKYIKLYKAEEDYTSVYFLEKGDVSFYVDEVDKYSISGKGLIFGVTEVLMNLYFDQGQKRIETSVCEIGTVVKKISIEKFMEGIKQSSFLINIAMVLAKQLKLTNDIASVSIDKLEGDDIRNRKYSLIYYKALLFLKTEYSKRKLPWIKEIITEFETSLTYKRGEAFHKSEEPTIICEANSLNDNMIEYVRDTVLCEENSIGDEMFVLVSGVIDVIIKDKKVATISEPGIVIGEMALLLGEKRTATLKAKNNVVVTKIGKSELKKISQNDTAILEVLVKSLVKRHYYNVVRISDVNRSILEKKSGSDAVKKISEKSLSDVKKIKKMIEKAIKKNDAEYLKPILELIDLE